MEKKERLTEGYKYVHRDASCPFFLHFPRFSSFPSFFSFLLVFFSLFSLLFPLKCIRGVASDSFSSPHLSKGEGGGEGYIGPIFPAAHGGKTVVTPCGKLHIACLCFRLFLPYAANILRGANGTIGIPGAALDK